MAYPLGGCFTQKTATTMFLLRVSTWNWKRGQPTYEGKIHSLGNIPDLDRKRYPCKKEEQATLPLRGLPGSQKCFPKGWLFFAHH